MARVGVVCGAVKNLWVFSSSVVYHVSITTVRGNLLPCLLLFRVTKRICLDHVIGKGKGERERDRKRKREREREREGGRERESEQAIYQEICNLRKWVRAFKLQNHELFLIWIDDFGVITDIALNLLLQPLKWKFPDTIR